MILNDGKVRHYQNLSDKEFRSLVMCLLHDIFRLVMRLNNGGDTETTTNMMLSIQADFDRAEEKEYKRRFE